MKHNITGYQFALTILSCKTKKLDYCRKRNIDLEFLDLISAQMSQLNNIQVQISQLNAKRKSSTPSKPFTSDEQQALKNAKFRGQELTLQLEKNISSLPNYPLNHNAQNIMVKKVDVEPITEIDLHCPSINYKQATLIAQSNFSYLKGDLASLHRALGQFMLDFHIRHHRYQEMYPPYLVNEDSIAKSGQLGKFADNLFKVTHAKHKNLYLIPTGEVPLVNYYANTLLQEKDLNAKLVALTPCFRRESAFGNKNFGLKRQHQFDKVELLQIVRPEEELCCLDSLVLEATSILDALRLPYRVIELGYKDLGWHAAKTYDIELMFKTDLQRTTYLEVSSCSTCHIWQSAKLNLRYRNFRGNKMIPCTLNGSGVAVGRLLIGFLCKYTRSDNSICIPKILRPYLNNRDTIFI